MLFTGKYFSANELILGNDYVAQGALIGFIYYPPEIFRKIRNFEKFPGKLKKFPGSLGYPDYPLLKGKETSSGTNLALISKLLRK